MKVFNVAIVGAGPGCLAIMDLLSEDSHRQLRMKLIGVADIDPEAPGIKKAREFLEDGQKIKFIIQFRGRQITHKEVGEEKLDKILGELAEIAEIEKSRWYEGKRLMLIVKPK